MAPKAKAKKSADGVQALRDAEEAADGAALLAEAMLSFRSPLNITNGGGGGGEGSSIGSGPTAPQPSATIRSVGPLNDDDDDDDDELMLTQREGESERGRDDDASQAEQPESMGLPPVFKEARHPPDNLAVEPNGRWDDGAKCIDKEGGLLLWCAKCGHRPRAEHEFRCRLHDEELSNGDERPAAPADLDDKMKMRRYKKDMDEWQPSFLERDDDEPPEVEDKDAYPCHCPACEGKTIRYDGGAPGTDFATSTRILVSRTEWLTESYKYAANAPQAVSERRFITSTGAYGYCVRCSLLVRATVETHSSADGS